jgi:hypothetical protein
MKLPFALLVQVMSRRIEQLSSLHLLAKLQKLPVLVVAPSQRVFFGSRVAGFAGLLVWRASRWDQASRALERTYVSLLYMSAGSMNFHHRVEGDTFP